MLIFPKVFLGTVSHENFGARNISPLNFRPKSLGGHRPPFLLRKNHDFGHVLLLRYYFLLRNLFRNVATAAKRRI